MSTINYLTSYLNPRKYSSSNSIFQKNYLLTRIDQLFIAENQNIYSDAATSILIPQFDVDFYKVYDSFPNGFDISSLYVSLKGGSLAYYFQKEIDGNTKYLSLQNALDNNLEDTAYQILNDQNFIRIIVSERLFYNIKQERLYLAQETPPEININTKRTLSYNPSKLGGLANGNHFLDYKDASGFNDGIISSFLNTFTGNIFASDQRKRRVKLTLNPQKGEVYWYPQVTYSKSGITLTYHYNPRENEQFPPGTQEFAIQLFFHHPESFFVFMKLTYFMNGISPLEISEGNANRKSDLFVNYVQILNILMRQNEANLDQKLAYLFYIPEDFFLKNQNLFQKLKGPDNVLGLTFIWDTIGAVLKGYVSNTGIDRETILLKLLQLLKFTQKDSKAVDPKRNDYILSELLLRKVSPKKSFLLAMYDKIDGENFPAYTQYLYQLWRRSSYANPAYKAYTDTSQLTGNPKGPQLILPYKTNKLLGFYTSNMDLEFTPKENIVVTPDAHSIDNVVQLFDPKAGEALNKLVEEDWRNEYHPLQPVYLADPHQDKAVTLHKLSPILFLKANEDQSFWSNVATATEYAFDIVTTASGIGNLAKFRHLARLTKVAKSTNQSRRVILSYQTAKVISGANAYAEISSGAVNALLKITGLNDTKFGKALNEFLFWIELATLSGEVTAAIKKGLQKNAKVLVIDEVTELEKHLDELIKKGEIDNLNKSRVINELNALTKVRAKKTAQFKQFLKNTINRDIDEIPLTEIINNIKGFTEQANKIAKAIESKKIKIIILDDDVFDKKLIDDGDSIEEAWSTKAFAQGNRTFYRSSSRTHEFIMQIIHEGTHALDNLEIQKLLKTKSIEFIDDKFGDNWSFEKRAYFHERAFTKSAFNLKDDSLWSIDDMLDHIVNEYEQY